MGLRAVVAKAVKAAFKATGDVPEQGYVRHYTGDPVRDMTTGVSARPYIDYPCQAIIAKEVMTENDANVPTGALEGIIQVSEVPAMDVNDVFVGDSDVWIVLDVQPDPTRSIWQLVLRAGAEVVS